MMIPEVLEKLMGRSSVESYTHHLKEAHKFFMNHKPTSELMAEGHNMFAFLLYSALYVLTFFIHKLNTGLMLATVQNYASAISFIHKLLSIPD